MIRIIVGTESNQYLAAKVLEYSIKRHTKQKVDVRPVYQTDERRGGTNFGFVRFNVPQICGYEGRAIYLDADQLVFGDIKELYELLDDKHSLAMVNSPEGYFGGKEVGKHNQTSVMVLNCGRLKHWNPETMFNHVVPNRTELTAGQIHYRDFMTLTWADQSEIQPLPPCWNHFNVVKQDTKLTHFSHVRSQPWKSPNHPLTALWNEWLNMAINDGAVTRTELIRETLRGYIHPWFLKNLLPRVVRRLGSYAFSRT